MGTAMRTAMGTLIALGFAMGVAACASDNGPLLVAPGAEDLDCQALKQDMKDAGELGENASARRRWVRQLMTEKSCPRDSRISISIGATTYFD